MSLLRASQNVQRSLAKIFTLALCTALLSSCSIKLTYSFLDNLMGWQLGRYVSLNGEQKKVAKAVFKDFHGWHRETQLTPYARYLTQVKQTILAGDITPEYLHAESNSLQLMLDDSLEYLLPGLTDVATLLTDEQILEVQKNLGKERKKYRKEYVDDSPEKIKKRRIRSITRIIGPFFGGFTKQQEQRLSDWENNFLDYEELMLVQQENWEARFMVAMEFREAPGKMQPHLRELMLYRIDNWDPELQKRLDINQIATFEMLADLFNSQTPKQQKKLAKKFDQYIGDFRSITEKHTEDALSYR